MGEVPVPKIATLRKAAGLTQRQLADAIGVTESSIRNLERNRNGVEQLERFVKLCAALNCDPSDLIEYQEIIPE